MYFLAWLIIGLIVGVGWLTGELLKGSGFGPVIGSGNVQLWGYTAGNTRNKIIVDP